MDRLDEIRCYMEKYIAEQVDISIAAEKKYMSQHVDRIKDKLTVRIRQTLDASARETDKIIICYLYSSIAIGKNELCLIPFGKRPFIEKPENEIYMDYSEILNLAIVNEAEMEKEMRKKFIRILPYEIEEIRREFMYGYSYRIGELLSGILSDGEEGIRIFFGTYMGEAAEIGRITV